MSFAILFKDEFSHFCKTRAMVYLWLGIPLIISIARLLPGTQGQLHQSLFAAFMASSLASMIAGSMLTASLISEIKQKVYIPFLTRPFKKEYIIYSRFFTVLGSLLIALFLAILIGLGIDIFFSDRLFHSNYFYALATSISLGVCLLSVSCSLGVLVGVMSGSLYSGIIIYLLIVNALNPLPMLIVDAIGKSKGDLLLLKNAILLLIGVIIPIILLTYSIRKFNKKDF